MIIVFGGAFNPPTKAHLNILNGLIYKYNPDRFIVVPVGNSYDKPALVSFEDRFNMLQIMAKHAVKPIEINDIEKTPPYKGTYETLTAIKKLYGDDDLYFVIGTDHLRTISTWLNVEKLMTEFKFIVVRRKNFCLDFSFLKNNDCQYEIYDFDSEIASTKFRISPERFKDDLLSEVYEYIEKNNIYGGAKDV